MKVNISRHNADEMIVDVATQMIVAGIAGQEVDLVVYDEGLTKVFRARVKSAQPLVLQVDAGPKEALRIARKAMILTQTDGLSLRGEGHLDGIRWVDGSAFLEISNANWEVLDRRRHPRFSVDVPVEMRLVSESADAPAIVIHDGRTVDMSISGAFVKMDQPPAAGSLVNFTAWINSKAFKALALVAHAANNGKFGVHFVECYGSGNTDLQNFLSEQEAA